MANRVYDMTSVYWSFIQFVCNMSYQMLQHTRVFNTFQKVAYTTAKFKLHMSILDGVDDSAFYDSLPMGVQAVGEWMIFEDFNRLFWGMYEIYNLQEDSPRRKQIMQAMRVMVKIAEENNDNHLLDIISKLSVNDVPPGTEALTESIDTLFADLNI